MNTREADKCESMSEFDGLSIEALRDRLTNIIDENERAGRAHRNRLPFALRIQTGKTSGTASLYTVETVSSCMVTVGAFTSPRHLVEAIAPRSDGYKSPSIALASAKRGVPVQGQI